MTLNRLQGFLGKSSTLITTNHVHDIDHRSDLTGLDTEASQVTGNIYYTQKLIILNFVILLHLYSPVTPCFEYCT